MHEVTPPVLVNITDAFLHDSNQVDLTFDAPFNPSGDPANAFHDTTVPCDGNTLTALDPVTVTVTMDNICNDGDAWSLDDGAWFGVANSQSGTMHT